jgi:hypothetical protein
VSPDGDPERTITKLEMMRGIEGRDHITMRDTRMMLSKEVLAFEQRGRRDLRDLSDPRGATEQSGQREWSILTGLRDEGQMKIMIARIIKNTRAEMHLLLA